MAMLATNAMEPLSSSEIPVSEPERLVDVDQKHALACNFLEDAGYDALLLQTPASFAWFTSGGDCSRGLGVDAVASLFITPEARVVVCSNVDSARLFETEIHGLGFQLKERPWHEPRSILVEDLCRGRKVASDTGTARTTNVADQIRKMRVELSEIELQRIRDLGRQVTHAVEATARHLERGQSEAEIAGHLTHRLLRHSIQPAQLQVISDGRGRRFRHWSFGTDPVESTCTVAAVGRKYGLCVTAARTVSFGEPTERIAADHQHVTMALASGIHFAQAGCDVSDLWQRIQRIYEKCGSSDEWRLADQGAISAFEPAEVPILPSAKMRLCAGMAVHLHPSVGSAMGGETILVGRKRNTLLTERERWPSIDAIVKGTTYSLPDILRR